MMFNFVVKRLHFLSKIPFLVHFYDAFLLLNSFVFHPQRFKVIDDIQQTVINWEGIHFSMHHYGGLQINLNRTELAHLHGNGLLDVYVGAKHKTNYMNNLFCVEHHVLGNHENWVSFWIKGKDDYQKAITILNTIYLQKLAKVTN